jgi:hypothetical protein
MANPYRVGIELSMASNHAQVLGALSRSLLGVYPLVSQLTQHFDQLKLAIGGALSIAVGGEFLSILGHITEKTKGLSHEMTQLRKLGLTEPEVTRAQAEAVRITKAVPGTTELDALKILGQTYSVLGSENIKVAEALAKFENVIKNSADKLGATDQKQLYQAIRSADLIGS